MNFFLDQHGCAKNQVDAEIIISNLIREGWTQSENAEDADLIIINSCGFIESAKKESLDAVVAARKQFPKKKIILAGCLAERYAGIFKTELPEVNGIFGNGDLSLIGDVAKKVMESRRRIMLKPKQEGVCCAERLVNLSFKNSAFVKITEGCSNHCSFCAIPLIRGELRSRPAADVIAEIKGLLKKGVFEINLIGQDIAAYGGELTINNEQLTIGGRQKNTKRSIHEDSFTAERLGGGILKTEEYSVQKAVSATKTGRGGEHTPLYKLLEKISALKGNFWVRLLYIHPDHFPLDVLELIKNDARILPYFDIPFQSGDDAIIRAMNRKSTREEYIALVAKIKKALPNAAIRTTFLTGFPGESDEAFENTLDFLQKIRADWAGCFAYSKEDDTPAAKMKKQVAKKIAKAREKKLLEVQEKITAENLAKRVKAKGKAAEYDVLIEETVIQGEGVSDASVAEGEQDNNFHLRNRREAAEGFAIGRAWFQAPDVDGNFVVRFDAEAEKARVLVQSGKVVRVRAVALTGVDVDSVLIGDKK